MLGDALDFPASGDHGSTALLVGGALLFVAALFQVVGSVLLPLLAVTLLCRLAIRGYYVRVLRRSAVDPGADAPAFDDWGDLLGDGLYSLLIFLVYLLPFLALVGLAVGGGVVSSVDDPSAAIDAVRNAAGLALLLALFYFIVMSYVIPAAVTNFAHEGEFRAAFRLRTVLDGAFSEDYAVGWVLTTVIQLLVFPFALLLKFVLVGFFISFFVGVAVRYVLGRSFAAAMGFEAESADTATPTTTGAESPPDDTRPRSGVPGRAETDPGTSGTTDATWDWTTPDEPTHDESSPEGGRGRGDGDPEPAANDRPRTPNEDYDLFGLEEPSDEAGPEPSRPPAPDSSDDPEPDSSEEVGFDPSEEAETDSSDEAELDSSEDADDADDDPLAGEFR
jgi:hypothetical protein